MSLHTHRRVSTYEIPDWVPAIGMLLNLSMTTRTVIALVAISVFLSTAWVRIGVAQPVDAAGEGQPIVDPSMTVDQALERALRELEVAEQEGEEAEDAYNAASQLASFVLSKEPLNVTGEYILGRLAILANQPRDALARIEKYANAPEGRNDWYAFKLLGDLYLVSYPSQARAKYERALVLAPNESDAMIGIGRAELKLNRAEEAIEFAEKAIRAEEEPHADYRTTLAEALLLDKRLEDAVARAQEAVHITEEAVRDDPGAEDLLYELKDRYKLLVRCLTRLSDAYAERPDYLVQLVQTLQDQADLDRLLTYHEALRIIEQGAKYLEDRVTAPVLYEQARLNRLVGRSDEARSLLERALELDPQFEPARELFNRLAPEVAAAGPSSS